MKIKRTIDFMIMPCREFVRGHPDNLQAQMIDRFGAGAATIYVDDKGRHCVDLIADDEIFEDDLVTFAEGIYALHAASDDDVHGIADHNPDENGQVACIIKSDYPIWDVK